jgi:hypothetical protein
LRAIATTSGEPGTSRAASAVQEEVVVPRDEPERGQSVGGRRAGLEEVRRDLPQEQRRGRPVPVVALVAHLQRLSDQ